MLSNVLILVTDFAILYFGSPENYDSEKKKQKEVEKI